jgi:hypothetical protein
VKSDDELLLAWLRRLSLGARRRVDLPARLRRRRSEAAWTHAWEECAALATELFGTGAVVHETRVDLLDYVLQSAAAEGMPGLWLEFGVHEGFSLNLMAEHRAGTVYGFDSFNGLPEPWVLSDYLTKPAGEFAVAHPPKTGSNAEFVIGLFEDRLPSFLNAHPEPVAFAHIDCDLYSSTRTVLRQLPLTAGSILLFDDYYNYPNWREGEFRAFQEFQHERQAAVECIGYSRTGWNAAFRILSVRPPLGAT